MLRVLVVIATALDFGGRLAVDARPTAGRGHGVAASTTLNAVAFPGTVSKHEERDAWADAREQAVEDAALAQVFGVAIDEARSAKGATATCFHVTAAVAKALFPFLRHLES